MYRTAVIRMYDVLDEVFVNCVITEYDDLPGVSAPRVIVDSTSVPSVGADQWERWLYEGLRALTTHSYPE